MWKREKEAGEQGTGADKQTQRVRHPEERERAHLLAKGRVASLFFFTVCRIMRTHRLSGNAADLHLAWALVGPSHETKQDSSKLIVWRHARTRGHQCERPAKLSSVDEKDRMICFDHRHNVGRSRVCKTDLIIRCILLKTCLDVTILTQCVLRTGPYGRAVMQQSSSVIAHCALKAASSGFQQQASLENIS